MVNSDDGRITAYFWDDMMGGTMRYIRTIIRYMPLNGISQTFQFSEISDEFYGTWISRIYNLSKNVYLLVGENKGSTIHFSTEYFTIAVENNRLVPYNAFNGKASFKEYIDISVDNNEYKSSNLPTTIELFIDSQRLLFVFDGQKYNGNYRKYNMRDNEQ